MLLFFDSITLPNAISNAITLNELHTSDRYRLGRVCPLHVGQLGRIRHPQHSGHEQHQQPAKDRAELQHEPTENLAHKNLPRLSFQQPTSAESCPCQRDNQRVLHATRTGQHRNHQTDLTTQQDHVGPLVQLPGEMFTNKRFFMFLFYKLYYFI